VEARRPNAFDQTLNLPSSGRAETLPGSRGDETLESNDASPAACEPLQTVSFDDPTKVDAANSDTERVTPSAKTVGFDKTLNLDRPVASADDYSSEHTSQTMSLGKLPTLDGPPIESDGADESHTVAKTVVIDKTVSLDASSGVSGTIDTTSTSTVSGGRIAPTVLLRTLEVTGRPAAESGEAVTDPLPAPTPASNSELKPPNLPGYKVLSELGRGGMGVVYRARHEKRNREVALKTLLHISPVELQRFKQEFRSLADIAHPNLAGLYELLSDGETWCFSMEILEAVDFTEYVWSGFEALRRQKGQTFVGTLPTGKTRLTPEVKTRLYEGLKQLVLGLNTLHQAGMLHRDIKPSNVLVTTEGRVVLVDFGLAAQFEEGSEDRPIGIQGTPEYMAPEQAACNPLSPAADWYAVGVMIYEVLTGYFPIDGSSLQIIFRKQTDTPKPPRELEPTVSDDLNDLCVALLDIDHRKRSTAADVLRCIGAEELIESLHASTRVGSGQTLELVGREGHLRGLQSSFRQVSNGKTKTIFVHGKSGMGKSVLIQKFLERVREKDQAVVLSGRCYEQESVPFKALDNLIDSLADHLAGLPEPEVRTATPDDLLPLIRLFPVLGQIPGATDTGRPSIENVEQQELRQRAMNALRELLKRLGERKPLVLYIDDLQWGDDDSADLLADLVRPPDAPRVLVLGSYRTENREKSHCLKAIDKAYASGQYRPHREEIAVDSLQEADAQRLALMLLSRDDKEGHELAGKIARESRGWPFFVWELAQHVQDTPEIADQSLELDEVIWARVNRLPAEARRLLELVAVTGRPIPALEAYQAIGELATGQSSLAQLRTRNFIRTSESEDEDTIVETYHDRIRESVVQHLAESTVREHSLNLALTIERVSGLRVEDLREHIAKTPEFEEAGEPYELEKRQWQRVFDLAYFFDAAGDSERAFPFALVAAERARSQNALEVAEQQYRIAKRGSNSVGGALRFRVTEGLGDILMLRGRYDGAEEQLEDALALVEGDLALARIEGKLGELFSKRGDQATATMHIERALAVFGKKPPSHSAVIMLLLAKEGITQVLHSLFPSRFVGRRTFANKDAKTDLVTIRLYGRLSYAYWFCRGLNFTVWAHLRQLNLAECYLPTLELANAYSAHAPIMSAVAYYSRGIDYAKRSLRIRQEMHDLWGQGQSLHFYGVVLFAASQFDECIEKCREAIRFLESTGDYWESCSARYHAAESLYHLGDLRDAVEQAKIMYRQAVEVGDASATAYVLVPWTAATRGTIPYEIIEAEYKRPREDALASVQLIQAAGLRILLGDDNPEKAIELFVEAMNDAKRHGLQNTYVMSNHVWLTTSYRILAERAENGSARQREFLRKAKSAGRKAVKVSRKFQNNLAHSLRENAILAAMESRESVASKLFEESLAIADQQHAKYQRAKTLLARGQAGLKFGWPRAEEQVAQAQKDIEEMEDMTGA
jgi:two-component system sensor kinase